MGTQFHRCRSSSKHSLVRPSPSRSKAQTLSKQSKQRSKTKRVSLQTSNVLSSLASNSKMAAPSKTTTSKKSPPSTLCSGSVEGCRSSSKHSLVRPSPSRSRAQTPSKPSKQRSKTKKVSLQTSNVLSLLASNSKMAAPSKTTTSKKSPPSTLCSGSEE